MCGTLFSCFKGISSCFHSKKRPVPFTDAELYAMPGTQMPSFSAPPKPRQPTAEELFQLRRTGAYSTRSNLSSHPLNTPRVNFPRDCPAGERAIRLQNENMLREQRENLSISFDTHHTFREPPPSDSTSSASTAPIYATELFDDTLAMRYARVGKPKVDKSRIPHAPPPGKRRPTRFEQNFGIGYGEKDVGEWRYEPWRQAEAVGYRLPRQREKQQSFLVDLAKTQEWLKGNPERGRREARDRRLADARRLPPPTDPAMRRRAPLRMAGGFPTDPTGPWHGARRPELPEGVAWRAGGSLPQIAPGPSRRLQISLGQQRRGRSMAPNFRFNQRDSTARR
jgi:hypothetical protein